MTSKQLWELVSFSGRFHPEVLEEALRKDENREESAAETKMQRSRELTVQALEARGRLRLALSYDRIRTNRGTKCLNAGQLALLKQLDDGSLHWAANTATLASGSGRLRNRDGQVMDIGGSTGGFTRRILDDWVPPDWMSITWD